MDLIAKFFAAFDGPAWATALISTGAVIVSVVALVRTRVPKPHWELLESKRTTLRGRELGTNPDTLEVVYDEIPQWTVTLRQNGPGTAESVTAWVKLPGNAWTRMKVAPEPEVSRGIEIVLVLATGEKVTGEYLVQVKYRRLPNTRKVRTWEQTVRLE